MWWILNLRYCLRVSLSVRLHCSSCEWMANKSEWFFSAFPVVRVSACMLVCACVCVCVLVLITSYISYGNCQQCKAATAERRVASGWGWPTTQLTPAPAILAAQRAVGSLFINARWRRSRRSPNAVSLRIALHCTWHTLSHSPALSLSLSSWFSLIRSLAHG